MTNTIVQFAEQLIDGKIQLNVEAYTQNYCDDIDGLYLDIVQKDKLLYNYKAVLNSRTMLSEKINPSLFNLEEEITYYLESIRLLFLQYFTFEGNKASIVSDSILKQIVYTDVVALKKSNTHGNSLSQNAQITIGMSNPIVLESLLICSKQINDFKELVEDIGKEQEYTIALYREHLINKIDRLFRDIIILYENHFYRITEYNSTANTFIAQNEDVLESIETISATRLYEKISKYGLQSNQKVLIIGKTIGNGEDDISSIDLLKRMVGDGSEITVIDSKQEIHDILKQSNLLDCIKKYNKIFILDCPEIYYPIELKDMDDYNTVIRRANKSIKQILSPTLNKRDFYNKNGFAAIYYRVQNYLLDKSRPNTSKSRRINTAILDFIKEQVDNTNEDKDIYVYISNNRDFREEFYDIYNFTRLERYNSKDCRIIRFGKIKKPNFRQQKCVQQITIYKILKMISNREAFHAKFTDCFNGFIKTTEISKNTKIFIDYSDLTFKDGNYCFKINIEILHPDIISISSKYKQAINTLIKEAFNFDRVASNQILLYCYKKAFANVLSGCARNFNDLLFYHLYMNAVNNMSNGSNFMFKLENIKYGNIVPDDDTIEENTSYSYKRVAYKLMTMLDTPFYRSSSIVDQYRMVTANNEKLHFYIEMLIEACENVGYTSSKLYSRLNELY